MITGAGYAASICALMLGTLPAVAGTTNSPECHTALADADHRTRAVQLRQLQFTRYDAVQNCRLLRANLEDLIAAREPMEHCLTGRDHNENVGQMDASIEEIRAALIANCRR